MMVRRVALGMIAGSAMVLLSGCGIFGKSISYRYRLTVEVDTPQGVKTGWSVIQVDQAERDGLEGSHIDTRVTGEAVAVNLSGGKVMFALLDQAESIAYSAIDTRLEKLPNDAGPWHRLTERMKDQEGVYEVPRTVANFRGEQVDAWPMLVTFGNLNDPRSMVRVDPDNAAATLGAGMSIRRITVEITDDDVTSGIEKTLGWLDNLSAYRTDKDNPFRNVLPREVGLLRMQERVR